MVPAAKNPPTNQEMQEVQIRSMGQELLQLEMATYSSILAWKIPWTEETGGLLSGVTKSWTQLSD